MNIVNGAAFRLANYIEMLFDVYSSIVSRLQYFNVRSFKKWSLMKVCMGLVGTDCRIGRQYPVGENLSQMCPPLDAKP